MGYQTLPPTTLTGPTGAQPTAPFQPQAQPGSGSPANPILLRLSGPFTGLQGVFEGSFDQSGAFASPFPIRAMQAADGAVVAGTVSVPDSTVANPQAAAYYLFPDAGMSVRFRVTALASGSPVADGKTTDFFQPASGTSSNTALQTLLELQRIRIGISILCDNDLKGLPQGAESSLP